MGEALAVDAVSHEISLRGQRVHRLPDALPTAAQDGGRGREPSHQGGRVQMGVGQAGVEGAQLITETHRQWH